MAISFYQLRSVLSQMDVPTRESYTMAVVEPDERVAMAGIGGVGRSGASVIGPAAGTALWNALGASAPFVGCGIFKVSYDLLIYTMFRKVKPPEEEKRTSELTKSKRIP
jgi:predicted MFS family arabinose efflux permease